ncbi:MAG: glycoside hydrolase family 3 C-terminal domain-containing protein [Lachnospiraceae bacterium]|nr:glycoside hydrolase family 3 C-terminal domain-containing protein [Lachnospiraceae bacterium]
MTQKAPINHSVVSNARYDDPSVRSRLARDIAEEGIILLKNDDSMLPFGTEKVAVFGRTQVDMIPCGTGSALCQSEYTIDVLTGMENAGIAVDQELAQRYRTWSAENQMAAFGVWGSGAHVNPEMPISDETVRAAASRTEKAVMVIGRTAGENDDVVPIVGDYLLSLEEKELLEQICRYFDQVAVVINSGNLIDLAFTERSEIKAIVLLNLPGLEGGSALGRILSGQATPSGHLTDTVAKHYTDYPASRFFGKKAGIVQTYKEDIFVGYRYFETFEHAKDTVMYPFGYGLSYTTFAVKCVNCECVSTGSSPHALTDQIRVTVSVTNTGDTYSGKEVVMLYSSSPKGRLGTPAAELRTFAKTKLLAPGEETVLTLSYEVKDMASFDDTGVLGTKDAWVLMPGSYTISLGNNIKTRTAIGQYENPEPVLVKTCTHLPTELTARLTADGTYETLDAIPLDPAAGVPVAPIGACTIEKEQYFTKDDTSITYRLSISTTGVYTVRFLSDVVTEVTMNGAPLADYKKYYGEHGADLVLSHGSTEFTFAAKDGKEPLTAFAFEKNDSPITIEPEGASFVEGGKYMESALWVVNCPFSDKNARADAPAGAPADGFALARMHTPGRYAMYKLNVKQAGFYDVRLRYSSHHPECDLRDTLSFLVSNVNQDIEPVTLEHTTDDPDTLIFRTSAPIRLALHAGEAYLKIVSSTTKSPVLAYLEFTPSTREVHIEKLAVKRTEEPGTITEFSRSPLATMTHDMDFRRVMNGTLSMDEFVNDLTDEELSVLTCGNTSGRIGYLPARGIPEAYWSDGPVGLRLNSKVTVYPSGTMLASSWNPALGKELGRAIGREAHLYNIDVWLAPGMNIHRDPCCGRNFEYHSEDPYVTGTMVSAIVKGVQEEHVAATVKHFAANNTEYQRLRSNSRISARAFYEIYARGFELAIRSSAPYSIMTSYNHINGIKVCENPLICEGVMRNDFGFQGVLMSDFGNDSVHLKEAAAGHDLKMSFGDPKSIQTALEEGTLDRNKVRLSVKRILEMIWKTAGVWEA